MVRIICIVLIVAAAMVSAAPNDKPHYDLNDAPELFEKFIEEHHRVYKNDADRAEHYKAFLKSLQVINDANSEPGQTATFDINEFADYTPEEEKMLFGVKDLTEMN
ncbi:fruit bromelain-like [Zerene cesonia]|uniref:fruit bromelain-like n=1 Tax=Zerene cesonia TaxID=33412 RepID=UPI0018E5018A|nr:fruit bromelain-like [Zerene cesonia]